MIIAIYVRIHRRYCKLRIDTNGCTVATQATLKVYVWSFRSFIIIAKILHITYSRIPQATPFTCRNILVYCGIRFSVKTPSVSLFLAGVESFLAGIPFSMKQCYSRNNCLEIWLLGRAENKLQIRHFDML